MVGGQWSVVSGELSVALFGGQWLEVGTVPRAVATGFYAAGHNPVATARGTVPTTDHLFLELDPQCKLHDSRRALNAGEPAPVRRRHVVEERILG